MAIRNTPAPGRIQRLHFYNVEGVEKLSLYQNLKKSLLSTTESMPRPWSENLLPYIEGINSTDIVLNESDLVIVKDGFPKVKGVNGAFI